MRVIGAMLLVGLFSGMIAIAPGASLEAFIDIPSALLVAGGTVAVLMLSEQLGASWLGVRFALGLYRRLDAQQSQTIVRFFATAGRGALACGLVGQLLGLIIMLGNLGDPYAIGPGLAVPMLSILYGLVLSEFVFHPLARRASFPLPVESRPPLSRVALLLILVVESLIVVQFSALFAAFLVPPPIFLSDVLGNLPQVFPLRML